MKPDAEWEEIKKIIMTLDLGYTYVMSDYCISNEEEANVQEKALKEVDKVVNKIYKLFRSHDAELGKWLDEKAKDILEHSAMKKEYKYAQLTLIDDIQSLLKGEK